MQREWDAAGVGCSRSGMLQETFRSRWAEVLAALLPVLCHKQLLKTQ